MFEYVDVFEYNYFEPLGFDVQKEAQIDRYFVRIPIEVLEITLEKISEQLSDESYAFANVRLDNIRPKNKTSLAADLRITKGEKRILQDIKILGYDKFPKLHQTFFGYQNPKPF